MKYVAYQGEMPVYVADSIDAFAYPQFGLRSEFEDVIAYEEAVATLNDEGEIAKLEKPSKELPFIIIDRIEQVTDADIVSGAVYVGRGAVSEARSMVAITQAKSKRAEAVEQITVEVDGLVFDGDEVSQERMARSIVALEDGETIIWVLHDNSIANVTKEQLKTALRLAGQKQTELWTKPYENASA